MDLGDHKVRLSTSSSNLLDLNRRMQGLIDTEKRRYTDLLDRLEIGAETEESLRAGARKVDDLRFASGAR